MNKSNLWETIEKILYLLLVISFLFLSENKITKDINLIVILLNIIYIIIYLIHVAKNRKRK